MFIILNPSSLKFSMASYGAITTNETTSNSPSLPAESPWKDAAGYYITMNIPSSPELAATRIVGNLQQFALYYTVFVWTVLFIALAPERKDSVVFLVAVTEVGFLYVLLLHSLPDAAARAVDALIDRRVVAFLLGVVACVGVIVTDAAKHLFIVLAATAPVVAAHAVLMVVGRRAGTEERDGEMARLVKEKLGQAEADYQSSGGTTHVDLV